MRNGVRPDFPGVPGDGEGLENAFRGYGDRIGSVAEHIAENHVFQALVVILGSHVQGLVGLGTQGECPRLIIGQLLRGETARIGADGVDLIAHFVAQVHHGIRRIQTAAVGHHDLLAGTFRNLSGRVVEHAGTKAAGIIVPLKDVEVRAALTSLPELGVLRKLRESDRLITQRGVDPHDLQARRQTEDLCLGILFTGELEGLLLDFLGQALALVFRLDQQAGVCHVAAVAPRLDIAESREGARISVQGDDGLVLEDLGFQVFRRTRSETDALVLVDRFERLDDFRDQSQMGGSRLRYNKIIHFQIFKFK